jgi:uncharacterized RDD family membrane protein YckC
MTVAAGGIGARAGFITRLLAFVADIVILWSGLRATVWLLDVVAHGLRRFAPPISVGWLVLLSAPVITAIYHVAFWLFLGHTPGKWLLGLRVVALGGGRIGLGRALLRFGGYFISALPFYLGFLWILGPDRRGFHDRLARTEVVYARRPGPHQPALGERPAVPRRLLPA